MLTGLAPLLGYTLDTVPVDAVPATSPTTAISRAGRTTWRWPSSPWSPRPRPSAPACKGWPPMAARRAA
ncbi:hypothetical protein WJ970_04320 [Achromobacter xylosoxidans]